VDFSEARDLFVIIFQILRPNCKTTDCRLILEKQRGLSAKSAKTGPRVATQGLLCKMAGNFGWGFIFQRIKSWTGSTHPWTGQARSVHRGPMAARTEGAGAWRHAHRSSASGRSGAPKLTGGGAIERGEHEELGSGLTGARAAAWRWRWRDEVMGNSAGRVFSAGEERRRAR
jgi:hypothetical protein